MALQKVFTMYDFLVMSKMTIGPLLHQVPEHQFSTFVPLDTQASGTFTQHNSIDVPIVLTLT